MLRQRIFKIKYIISLTQPASTTLQAKVNEVKGEIPSVTNLATTAALTAIKNKIPNVSI